MKPTKHLNSFARLTMNTHLLGAVLILVIILLLFLTGCATRYNQRISSSGYDDCKELMKKRYAKVSRQPKMQPKKISSGNNFAANRQAEVVDIAGPENKSLSNDPPALIAPEIDNALPLITTLPTAFAPQNPPTELSETITAGTNQVTSPSITESGTPTDDTSFPDPFMQLGFLVGAPALISLLLLRAFTSTSMKVSAWAAHHPRTTKGILGAVHIGGNLAALLAGNYFGQQGAHLGEAVTASATAGFVASALLYPNGPKTLNRFSADYFRQKFHDVALFSTGIALSLSAGSNLTPSQSLVHPQSYETSILNSSPQTLENVNGVTQQNPPEKKNGKITMTILASLFFTAGILVVAGLACNLSCSGFGTGAVLVGVLGGAGMILAYVAMLKNINKRYKVKHKKAVSSEL